MSRRNKKKRKDKRPIPLKPEPTTTPTVPTYNWSLCEHWREPVNLLNDLQVTASAYSDRKKSNALTDIKPDFGVYFDDGFMGTKSMMHTPGLDVPFEYGGIPAVYLYWQDYHDPESEWVDLARWVLKNIEAGKVVDIGCFGGHGRTGTAIATLLILQGMSASAAITKVRTEYCDEAIEGHAQSEWLKKLADAEGIEGDDEAFEKVSSEPANWTGWTGTTTVSDEKIDALREELLAISEDAVCQCEHTWLEHDFCDWENEVWTWCQSGDCKCDNFAEKGESETLTGECDFPPCYHGCAGGYCHMRTLKNRMSND